MVLVSAGICHCAGLCSVHVVSETLPGFIFSSPSAGGPPRQGGGEAVSTICPNASWVVVLIMSTPHYLLSNDAHRSCKVTAWHEIVLMWRRLRPQSKVSCAVQSDRRLHLQTRVSSPSERISDGSLYKKVCVKFQFRVPRWSVSGSGVWLGPRRWRRLCCILRAHRRTVSRRCVSADEFWDSPGGSRPWSSPQTAEEEKQTGNEHIVDKSMKNASHV